jgi:hypothetical protein
VRRALAFAALSAALAAAALAGPAALHAQAARGPELTLFGGGGGVFPGSQPGMARSAGLAVVGGLELGWPSRPGLAGRLALRAEGGLATQAEDFGGDVAEGDVHTPHAALAARLDLLGRRSGARRLMPYLVAGGAWARPSTRLALREDAGATPGARFEQITHESVAGALAGGGLAWQGRRASLRAEARWLALATDGAATTLVPVVLTLAIPLHR